MGEEEKDEPCTLEVGDIVRESTLIIPPDRAPWMGIVVYIEEDYYELYSSLGTTELRPMVPSRICGGAAGLCFALNSKGKHKKERKPLTGNRKMVILI